VSLVALLTDFGRRDPYVAEVELQLRRFGPPQLTVIHLGHDVPAGDVAAANWLLRRAWPQLPDGAVCLAVVDPGVGTARPAVAAHTGGRWFVGPGNGLAGHLATAGDLVVVRLTERRPPAGLTAATTFDGRDLFAPAAGRLAAGTAATELGSAGIADDLGKVRDREPGAVVWIDHYGNLVTDLARDSDQGRALAGGATITVAGRPVRGPVAAFADAAPGEAVWYWGSAGTLEVAVDRGSAAAALGAEPGLVIVPPGP